MKRHLISWFVSPTNLHCSQTVDFYKEGALLFVSPTNLHCSQTGHRSFHLSYRLFPLRIYTALKPSSCTKTVSTVCFPYEFTLLSNGGEMHTVSESVCFPYEFTLLSNNVIGKNTPANVCFPYEFTLLSNIFRVKDNNLGVCFPYEFTLLSN